MNLKNFFTYILESTTNSSYYIGSCQDVCMRLKMHNSGMVKSTKHYMPWILVYHEKFDSISEARKRESKIKLWKSRRAIRKLVKKF